FYQLLGIARTEQDTEVIEEAAIRQTTHVRAYQIGKHAADATRVLNEISQARTALLNPAKRREYDADLARKAAQKAGQTTAQPPPPAANLFAGLDEPAPLPISPQRGKIERTGGESKAKTGLYLGLGVGGLLLALLFLIVLLPKGGDPQGKGGIAQNEKKD